MTVTRVVFALWLAGIPVRLVGQEVSSTLPISGKTVRIHVSSLGKRAGYAVAFRSDTLVLFTNGQQQAFPRSVLDSVWVRKRATVVGALSGAALGGLAVGIWAVAACGIGGTDYSIPECAAVGALYGAVPGALVGAGIGALIPRWSLWHPPGLVLEGGPHATARGVGLALTLRTR